MIADHGSNPLPLLAVTTWQTQEALVFAITLLLNDTKKLHQRPPLRKSPQPPMPDSGGCAGGSLSGRRRNRRCTRPAYSLQRISKWGRRRRSQQGQRTGQGGAGGGLGFHIGFSFIGFEEGLSGCLGAYWHPIRPSVCQCSRLSRSRLAPATPGSCEKKRSASSRLLFSEILKAAPLRVG